MKKNLTAAEFWETVNDSTRIKIAIRSKLPETELTAAKIFQPFAYLHNEIKIAILESPEWREN